MVIEDGNLSTYNLSPFSSRSRELIIIIDLARNILCNEV